MPCNIGYKIVAKVKIPEVVVQKFKEEIQAPQIDQDLLEKIGEDDPAFSQWLNELDIKPLLEEALRRARI